MQQHHPTTDALMPLPEPHIQHHMRRFLITFSNSRVHGAHPVTHHTAEGCMSSDGEIMLFTKYFFQKGFTNMNELKDAFEHYGVFVLDWIDQ